MLNHLSIKNYALIRSLELELHSGLTVLTGETGSGKSIILGALGLVLGERADIKSLANTERKCVVEATFQILPKHKFFFENNDLDFHLETHLRREISSSGKSRAFINDTPVNLNQLRELGDQLVEIHSQDQNTILSKKDFQFEILDTFSDNLELTQTYKKDFLDYKKLNRRIQELKELDQKAQTDLDYYSFQLNELKESQLDFIDREALESEFNLMTNAEEIGLVLSQLKNTLDDGESAINGQLNELIFNLGKKEGLHSEFGKLSKRLDSVLIELQDIYSDADRLNEQSTLDPERLEQVQKLINEINLLETKHRVSSVEALIEVRDALEEKLDGLANLEDEILSLTKELDLKRDALIETSKIIGRRRVDSISKLENRIETTLNRLGLDHALLKIDLQDLNELGENGLNDIQFLFCANPGSSFLPIDKVASGGEKSRLLLALKKVFSDLAYFPTLILDEIDSGVSGEIALRVGEVMEDMSQNSQLLCITHLPQIAGMGMHHFKVNKEVVNNETRTYISALDREERIEEIAEMLSGKNMTDAARDNARILLKI